MKKNINATSTEIINETARKIFSIVEFSEVHSCKPCRCALCDEVIPNGKMRAKVRTRRQPIGTSFCMDCWEASKNTVVKAEKLVTGKKHTDTKYNISDNHKFGVHILFDDDEIRGYLLVHGWIVFGKNGFFWDDSHHAITKFLDEIFTSGYPVTVTVNSKEVKTTEDCRDVLKMKVRNARVNKSIKK